MSKTRFSLSDDIAEKIGLTLNSTKRYRLKQEQIDRMVAVKEAANNNNYTSVDNNNHTSSNDYKTKPKFVLSAWNMENGLMMDIDEYCAYYNLPRHDISSYKLVSHTGTPFYNIVWRESTAIIEDLDIEGVINDVVSKLQMNIPPKKWSSKVESKTFTRLVYTDTHTGMDTNAEGTAMYPVKWDEQALFSTLDAICERLIANADGGNLFIDDLGDIADGWDGTTVRGGHSLPQNMTNEDTFRVALQFKVDMVARLKPYFNKITCHNITNDNHGGSFAWVINHAFKSVIEAMYADVVVVNIKEFISHYTVGNHAFVLSHGKDKKNLKFGFKPVLDSKQIEHIDHYLKFNDVYRQAKFIEFAKGNDHQFIFDYSTAQDFDYFNYPALSPSSEWVQTNYKRGSRGFVVQEVDYLTNDKKITPVFL